MTRAPIPELDDLDRYEGQVVTDADYTRMVQQFDALVYARVLAEREAARAMREAEELRVTRRKLYRRVFWWVVSYALLGGLALYLRSIGE